MPTSAACSATASLTPSPRKATSAPVRRATLMMPRLLVGADPGEDRRRRGSPRRARRRRARSSSAPVRTPSTVEPDVAADLGGDDAVVAGDDLHRRCRARASLAIDAPASAFGRSTKVRKPASRRSRSSRGDRLGQSGGRRGGDGDDAGAVGEQARRARPCAAAGTSTQRARTASGAPLVISIVRAVGRPDERRTRAGARGRRAARPSRSVRGRPSAVGSRGGRAARPQRAIERVAADGPVGGHGRLVADQAEQQRRRRRRARRVERRVEGDRALGERAGLVGEQHLDVAEVLDRHEPLDEHPLARERARPVERLTRDDRRQQLRRDADGDREREQQRVDQRARRARR